MIMSRTSPTLLLLLAVCFLTPLVVQSGDTPAPTPADDGGGEPVGCGTSTVDECYGVSPCFNDESASPTNIVDDIIKENCIRCTFAGEECRFLEETPYCWRAGLCASEGEVLLACSPACAACHSIDDEFFWCMCDIDQNCPGNPDVLCFPNLFPESNLYGFCTDIKPATVPCFSGITTVQSLLSNKAKYIQDLKVGDQVLVEDNQQQRRYETIYAFGHVNTYAVSEFLQIHHTNNNNHNNNNQQQVLEMTGEHLIYKKEQTDSFVAVRADNVQVGDVLVSNKNDNNNVIVTDISKVTRSGIYSPLTQGGYFIAGGSKVSSYTAVGNDNNNSSDAQWWLTNWISHHFLNHLSTTPYRFMCSSSKNIMEGLCSQRNHQGQLLFVSVGDNLVQSTKNTAVWLICLLLLVILPLYALEQLLFVTLNMCGVVLLLFGVIAIRVIISMTSKRTK